jgi:hypothetical protein
MNDKFDFGGALNQLRNGFKVAREGWNGKGMYVTLKPGYPDGIEANEATCRAHNLPPKTIIEYRPFLEMKTADNQLVPWVASQSDILAEDWVVVQ